MEREYRNIDKSQWARGEWDDEPDKVQWKDADTGLPCLLVRNPVGALCGYVGVPEGHPLFGHDYGDVDVDVHGGLTFSNRCNPQEDEGRGICHVPDEGEPDHVWWLGFDCAHAFDYAPAMSRYRDPVFARASDEQYRNVAYVKAECRKLAAQLKDYHGS